MSEIGARNAADHFNPSIILIKDPFVANSTPADISHCETSRLWNFSKQVSGERSDYYCKVF
jgi:hypothetical protein